MSLDQLDAFLAHARADAALDRRLHDPADPRTWRPSWPWPAAPASPSRRWM